MTTVEILYLLAWACNWPIVLGLSVLGILAVWLLFRWPGSVKIVATLGVILLGAPALAVLYFAVTGHLLIDDCIRVGF
jgi:hypothetical protein